MSNMITNLVPDAYAALNVVSRELVGFTPAVTRDSSADRLAIGQTLRSAVPPVNTAAKDITAAMSLPAAADQNISNISLTITKARAYPFSWSGEQQYAISQGPGLLTVNQQQIAQAGEIPGRCAEAARAPGRTLPVGDHVGAELGAHGFPQQIAHQVGKGVAVELAAHDHRRSRFVYHPSHHV